MTDEQPRLAPLAAAERTELQQKLIEAVGSEKHIYTTLVRHPDLFDQFRRFAGRLLRRSALPPQVRETLILRTAYRCGAAYEWAQHIEIAAEIGLPADVITALGTPDPAGLDEHIALLARAADQLTAQRDLDDTTWYALSERYDEQQMIELCMLVGDYAMIAGVLKSLRVPLERGQSAPDWNGDAE